MRDPYRLQFHITPYRGWMNDPNGFTTYRGEYHIFYQAYPYAAENGTKHWGHVVTKDFVVYTRLPIALRPDAAYDYQGCYSGSAIEKDGILYLLYTGHVLDKSPKEEQCLAYSKDGITFRKYAGNPVIHHPKGMEEDFRDPYIWKKGDFYYCVIGCRHENRGRVLLYRSLDLVKWDFMNVMLEGTADNGTMWECPSYTEVGDTAVLFLSPENRQGVKHSTLYYIGTLDYETGEFQAASEGQTDYGTEFYAPQVINAGERNILIAWMDNWESKKKSKEDMWCGALSYPREVCINQGKLYMTPVKELEQSERERFRKESFSVMAGENCLSKIRLTVFDLELKVLHQELGKKALRLSFREGSDEEAVVLRVTDQEVCLSIVEKEDCRTYKIKLPESEGEEFYLRILVDMSSVELFLAHGLVNATYRFYISEDHCGLSLLCDGDIDIKELAVREIIPFEFREAAAPVK